MSQQIRSRDTLCVLLGEQPRNRISLPRLSLSLSVCCLSFSLLPFRQSVAFLQSVAVLQLVCSSSFVCFFSFSLFLFLQSVCFPSVCFFSFSLFTSFSLSVAFLLCVYEWRFIVRVSVVLGTAAKPLSNEQGKTRGRGGGGGGREGGGGTVGSANESMRWYGSILFAEHAPVQPQVGATRHLGCVGHPV